MLQPGGRGMKGLVWSVTMAIALWFAQAGEVRSQSAGLCELDLILAIDVSGSVSRREYHLQIGGLADAFRTDDIIRLLTGLAPKGVYISVVQWSGEPHQELMIPRTRITGPESVRALAGRIEALPRAFRNFSTAIGEVIAFSLNRFEATSDVCKRRVIDISGDGRNNEGVSVERLRDLAASQGVTINGLAILGDDRQLSGYFRNRVVGGNGAFVISVDRFEDYPDAIRRKLLREIAPRITSAE